MKLLRKYRTYTYISLVFVIIIGLLSNYFLFKHSVHRSADKVIDEYCSDIEDYAREYGTLTPLMAVNSKFGLITQIDKTFDINSIDTRIVDTLAYNLYQDEMVIFRKKVFHVQADDGDYLVRLMIPTLDDEDLVGTVIISLLIFTSLFILFTTMIDQTFSKKIFLPFNKILAGMKHYDLEKRSLLNLPKNDIDEFNELNRILTEMMNKINNGYYEMKDFLEYASHELQTPLSVIQLKLEMLNEMHTDNPEILDYIASIQKCVNRAIRFNRNILFLAKIRNDQYADRKLINLKILLNNQIRQLEEMFSIRNITVSYGHQEDFRVKLHPLLAENLMQNILSNAIKHNVEGGDICISFENDEMTISNSFSGVMPKGNLFKKYNHATDKRDSHGLGLAIAQAICVKNNLDVDYLVEGNRFTVRLSKRK